jgi:hypothetical protein
MKSALLQIPWIGKTIAKDLMEMGITEVQDLRGRDPEALYDLHNRFRGSVQDPCMFYTFRCAVYYADTPPEKRDPELLKWWNWKNRKYTNQH